MVGTEWNQRKVPSPLDRGGHRALVLGADAGLAAGLYLPPVGHVPAKAVSVLVVYVLDMVNAEAANLSAAVVARPASSESTRSAARSPAGPASTWTVSTTTGPTSSRAVATATGPASASRAIAAALLRAAGPRSL